MTSKRLVLLLTLILCIPPSLMGQSPTPQNAMKAEQAKKAQEELKRKALALIEEIIKESRSLILPENRIRIQIETANLLWPLDAKRAGILFRESAESFNELSARIDNSDSQNANFGGLLMQLRQEMLQIASQHDARLALDFLRATRNSGASQLPPYYGQRNFEAQIEIRLASQVADKDPAEALRIAQESLEFGIDQETLNFVSTLQAKDKDAASRFLSEAIKKLRTEDLTKNPGAFYASVNLIKGWAGGNQANSTPVSGRVENGQMIAGGAPPTIDKRAVQELAAQIINTAMSGESSRDEGYPSYTQNYLAQLQPMFSDIEHLAPAQAPALKQRIAELEKLNMLQSNPWMKYQELLNTGTAEAVLEAAKGAPPQLQRELYQQAAWKALNAGDSEMAREIITEKITEPNQRREMMSNIDRQMAMRASEQDKLDEALALVGRLTSLEERVNYLCQFAVRAASKGDKSRALQLINQAQGLLNSKAQNYSQMQAQLQIAGACAAFESGRGMLIIESVIDQINELAAAALILNGFDIQQYFREGEFILSNGNSLNNVVEQVAEQLSTLAPKDFDRARSIAERFQRPELRVRALVRIAQAALNFQSSEEEAPESAVGQKLFSAQSQNKKIS